jgi:acyl carrier protein
MDMRDRIKKVMQTNFDLTEVNDNISQQNCAKWDSLKHLNLMLALESEFNISLEPEEIAEMKSLEDIERTLRNLINE